MQPFFIFRIKQLDKITDINISDIHGHAFKRAFEFYILAYLAECRLLMNVAECLPNVKMSRNHCHSDGMTEQNYITFAYS